MSNIKERDKEVIWHPYTPMKLSPEAIGIVRGEGAYLIDEDGNKYIDAIASWWVNLHGHSHPYIAKKISEQLTTLEHCIFAGFTHEPAVSLAERLLAILPGQQKKVFYSDNGSTAVEVAIKMSLQYWNNVGTPKKRIIALEDAYHGDTFGAMSVSGRSIFTESFKGFLFDVDFISFPSKDQAQRSVKELEELLKKGDVAAFIVEPLIQGTAGMRMYSPEVLEQYFSLCKKYNALIIADEVMTGFGRTNTLFACDQVTTAPDMICLSKGLTGGTMPMGITTCAQHIFDAFYDDDRMKTLYHGHSYTANPIACTAGLASLDITLSEQCLADRTRIIAAHKAFAQKIVAHPSIKDIRQEGTIIALELNTGTQTSYHNAQRDFIYKFFLGKGILMRPLGNIIYIIPPYCISSEQLQHIYNSIEELLTTLSNR